MAAAGTGLDVSRGQVATTPTDMQGFGAGEMAAAEGLAQAAAGLGRLVDVIEPAAQEQARTIAEQEVAAGRFEQRTAITGADQAFNQAMRTGTLARLGNQRDQDLDALRLTHAFDPDAYAAAATEYRSSAIGGAVPPSLAMEWAADFDQRSTRNLGTIRSARAERDIGEARDNIVARNDRLIAETINLRPGASLGDVMADDQVQGNLLQITMGFDELERNPAYGMGAEEVRGKRDEAIARIKAGAVSQQAVALLRTEGVDAALGNLQTILTDETVGTQAERQLAFNTAREAVNQEVSLNNQRRNEVAAAQNEAAREVGRLIEDDVASVELTGTGTGLTEDQVRAVGGLPAVSRWYRARAEATERNALVGDILGLGPEEAAATIVTRTAARGLETIPALADDSDMATVAAAIEQVESGGRNGLVSADPDGAGPAGGGAYGVMQIIPETARRIAGGLGLPYDQNRLRTDVAYNRQIGRAYLAELTERYRGDTFLAITAYHAGPGNVDGWLNSVGDPRSGAITREAWLNGVESRGNPRSAEYPRRVLAAMNGGRAAAAMESYQTQRRARLADPAASVMNDFPVRAARERWRENPTSVPASESMVQSFLDAQDRASIPAGQRRTLPTAMLVSYAAEAERFERSGDTEGYRGWSQSVVRHFGRHGAAVLQNVLEVQGNTQFASQISASMARMGAAGERPTRPQVEQAASAGRVETMTRAGAGTSGRTVAAMSDAELQALAYGQ